MAKARTCLGGRKVWGVANWLRTISLSELRLTPVASTKPVALNFPRLSIACFAGIAMRRYATPTYPVFPVLSEKAEIWKPSASVNGSLEGGHYSSCSPRMSSCF